MKFSFSFFRRRRRGDMVYAPLTRLPLFIRKFFHLRPQLFVSV